MSGEKGKKDAPQGDGEPEDGRRVLQEDDEDGRRLGLTQGPEDPSPFEGHPELTEGDAPGITVKKEGEGQDQKSPARLSQGFGLEDLGNPLAHREDGTDDEDGEGDDKGPEIPLPGMAKGMPPVRGLGAQSYSEQEKGLVARVGQGVKAFGQQGGAVDKDRGGQLHEGDKDIGRQGRYHRLFCPEGRCP